MGKNSKKGCIFAVLGCSGIAAIAAVVVGFYIYKQAKQIEEGISNPEPKAMEMLGVESMPEGYHANFAFKIPFLVDMVMMSNEPGNFKDEGHQQGEPFGDEGFIYLKFINFKKESNELQDYFEGKSDNSRVLANNGVHVNARDLLQRGVL